MPTNHDATVVTNAAHAGRPDIMNDLLALSHVPRWCIVAHSIPQTVATHCHRVAVILLELAQRLELVVPREVLIWALLHDGPEAWTGDIPGPFKAPMQHVADQEFSPWWYEHKKHISKQWLAFFKIADLIETGTFIRKFGIGRHSQYAADHILREELHRAVDAWCVATNCYYGVGIAQPIVTSVIVDILAEKGRCKF